MARVKKRGRYNTKHVTDDRVAYDKAIWRKNRVKRLARMRARYKANKKLREAA